MKSFPGNNNLLRPVYAVKKYNRFAVLGMFALPMLLLAGPVQAELTLQEAEQIAIKADPEILARRANAQALSARAVAEGQLPDPKFGFGIYNVPLDSFDLSQEPSTQFRTKITQAFPRGKSLKYKQKYTAWLGKAENANAGVFEKQIQRDTRETFLELYYKIKSLEIIADSRKLFTQMVNMTRVMFASGRVSQQDVIQAQLELSRLDERVIRLEKGRDVQRAKLERWIGELAWEPVANVYPQLPYLPSKAVLEKNLPDHPVIVSSMARVKAYDQLVSRAREQYKPGWNVGLEYRKRFGDNPNGSSRTDMMAAMVTMDIPLFTEKRQDKRLAASQQQRAASLQDKERRLRELRRMLEAEYARWQHLGEQQKIYETRLLEEARTNTRAALNAYESGTIEFVSLMRASITELDVRLQDLRIRTDRSKAQASLLYLLPASDADSASLEGDSK